MSNIHHKMALLWVAMLLVIATTLETKASPASFLESSAQQDRLVESLPVFQKGSYETQPKTVPKSDDPSSPPAPLYIVSPKKPGSYPVLLFIHGTMIKNTDYSDILEHIASHGFVVVAPQLWELMAGVIPIIPSQSEEIDMAAIVANWLSLNLQTIVPEGVKGNTETLAASGHSRGGKTAFALALGICSTKLEVKISAIIGLDPVAGPSKAGRTKPFVLNYQPNSMDLSFPTLVIGTGLGNQTTLLGPPCAPDEVNHEEFYNECKEGANFVVKDYGHMDMLNDAGLDSLTSLVKSMCKSKPFWRRSEPMRRTLGGLAVAYLKDVYLGEAGDYTSIIQDPSLAPAELERPNVKPREGQPGFLSQM